METLKFILSFVFAIGICASMSAQTFINSQADWDALTDPVVVSGPVFIQPGVSIVHNGNLTFNTELQVLGDLEIATGSFTQNQLLLVNQSGSLTVNGELTVNGFPAVLNDMATFTNNGISTFNDASGLTINSTGAITNNGTLTTQLLTVNSGGTVNNGSTGTLTSFGAIALNNGSSLVNDFTLNAQNGVFAGNGTYTNNGTTNAPNGLTIDGVAVQNNLQLNVMGPGGGAIVNGGSLTNSATVIWSAAGALAGDGTVTNTGNMTFDPGPLATTGDVLNCGTINGPPTFTVTGAAPEGTPCDPGLAVECLCENGVIAAAPTAIPTMSEWGLILLTLLSLSFVMVSMVARQTSLAGFGGSFSLKNMYQMSAYPFEKSIFEKALSFVLVMAIVAGIMSYAMYGVITATDFIGTCICGPILAYLLHLMVLVNQDLTDK